MNNQLAQKRSLLSNLPRVKKSYTTLSRVRTRARTEHNCVARDMVRIGPGKPLSELTIGQMAMLAGLPKAPARDNPIANPERAKRRQRYVLSRMRTLGFITEPGSLVTPTA